MNQFKHSHTKTQRGIKMLFVTLCLCISVLSLFSQSPYQDLSHNSKVFGHSKQYRLYLPKGYTTSSTRYPVIYFFHGWGGRHFKDDNAKLEYEKIKTLVDKYQVILVMWDGNIDEAEPRPYNIGNHGDVKFNVQMKDYFPELVTHIDASYRTLTDRQHRGIIGFSMGGFMSFFLAGKYPDMVTAAVSMTGSPEFFVGHPGNHTLYPMRYAFKNLTDVKTRMHTGDSDILYYLNEEVHAGAKWEGVPLDYYRFHGGHMVDDSGETKVFELAMKFVADAFKTKATTPASWSHYDLYGDFTVWGYAVACKKPQPGFVFLKNVTPKGFGLYSHRWLPDGPDLELSPITITTAPVYTPGKTYSAIHYNTRTNSIKYNSIKSDAQGRVTIQLDSSGYETGIFTNADNSNWVVADYAFQNNSRFLHQNKENQLSLRLLNRGGEKNINQNIRVTLNTNDTTIIIKNSVQQVQGIAQNRVLVIPPFLITCSKNPPSHAEPPFVKLNITIQVGRETLKDEIIVPVLFDVPFFNNTTIIDDGRAIRDKPFGKGNANGEANAGEQVVVYLNDHRLRLYTEDRWVLRQHEQAIDEMIPARWPDGFTLNSLIKIDPACPDGHIIECLASYETKAFNPIERNVTWGKVRIVVRNTN